MSVTTDQNKVNSLDKEISNLESKLALEHSKVSRNQVQISRISITSKLSDSTRNSRLRQVERHQNNIINANKKIATINKEIARKRKNRNLAYTNLQKSQIKERDKERKATLNIQQEYESRILELEAGSKLNLFEESEVATDPVFDIFVSHAWEDKESFVVEFVNELKDLGLTVWYDDDNILWGGSLRESIDQGIRKSTIAIVVLSPNYIAEGKYWTKKELNALFQMESSGMATFIPIWHNLTKNQILDYSPMIADKKAMTTANMTISELSSEMYKLISIINNSKIEGVANEG